MRRAVSPTTPTKHLPLRTRAPADPLLPSRPARLFVHLLRSALAAGATRLGVTGRVAGDAAVVELFDNGTPPETGPHPPANPFEPFARPRGRGPLVGAGVLFVSLPAPG